jgi:hypothetical protein
MWFELTDMVPGHYAAVVFGKNSGGGLRDPAVESVTLFVVGDESATPEAGS